MSDARQSSPVDPFVARFEELAKEWASDVARRRRISKTDPAADTLEYCVTAVRALIGELKWTEVRLTVDEYARREGVTPQTVRTWIRAGQLPAIETAKGYR